MRQVTESTHSCNRKYWTAMATPPIAVTTVLISPTAHSRVERGVVIKMTRMVASRAQPATQVANHEQRPWPMKSQPSCSRERQEESPAQATFDFSVTRARGQMVVNHASRLH